MSVAKQSQHQDLTPHSQNQDVGYVEESEKSTTASASAGVNLNLFGAIAGAFSSKSKKIDGVDQEERGQEEEVEKVAQKKSVEGREEQAKIKGAGAGNMNANAAGQAEQNARQRREVDA